MAAINTYTGNIIYKKLYAKYAAVFTFGMLMGFRIFPGPVVAGLYIAIAAYCLWVGIKEQFEKLFIFLPFLCYTEPYMRGYVRSVPYLGLQYLFLAIFGYLTIKHLRDKKPHSNGFILILAFALVELLNGLFPNDPLDLRPVLINSFSLIITMIWASFNTLSPKLILRLLTYVKMASIYLTGMVLVAHLQGSISYNTESNYDSSNGLAPVQLSGYLGWGSILLLFSFLNPEEEKYRILNLVMFIICCTVMILTFSRGGLYFLGVIMVCYLYFNKANFASYLKLLLFAPVGFLIYFLVVLQTGGAIVKRYEKKGSSNRDLLIEAGYKIFLDNPIIGVGTSNYNQEIVKRKYFNQKSTAHNEFVRSAAEHGITGVILYWGYFIYLFFEVLSRHGTKKMFSFYFLLLFCLISVHNGLKVSIQPLLIMLAIANPDVSQIKKVIRNAVKPTIGSEQLQPS